MEVVERPTCPDVDKATIGERFSYFAALTVSFVEEMRRRAWHLMAEEAASSHPPRKP